MQTLVKRALPHGEVWEEIRSHTSGRGPLEFSQFPHPDTPQIHHSDTLHFEFEQVLSETPRELLLDKLNSLGLEFERDLQFEKGRPYAVVLARANENCLFAGPDQFVVFKLLIPGNPDSAQEGMNVEVAFYEQFGPKVWEQLEEIDPIGSRRLNKPDLLHVSNVQGQPESFVISFHEGEKMGTLQEADSSFTASDACALASLIKSIQSAITAEEIHAIRGAGEADISALELHRFNNYKQALHHPLVEEILGQKYEVLIEQLLAESSLAQAYTDPLVMSRDVAAYNTLNAHGDLIAIDWERFMVGRNPGHDYSKIVTRLWDKPEVAEAYARQVFELNTETPDFGLMFRANVIGMDLMEMLSFACARYDDSESNIKWEFDSERAANAIPKIAQMIKDAVDQTGPFS